MGKIDNRSLWLFGDKSLSILKDKSLLVNSYMGYMMIKSLRMFEYKNLPETIPQRELELILQTCRFVIWTKDKENKNLFVFYGGLGGVPNEYYQPTQAIVSNPYLKFTKVLNLDDYIKDDGNAVLGWNDSMHMGLYPLNNRYACLLAECDLSLKYELVNIRLKNILTSDDDSTKTSVKTMFEDVENGTGYGIVVTKNFMEESSLKDIPFNSSSSHNNLKDIIESKQYLMGSWYNELGLNANYNMKREAINESEADLNEDSLLPMIDDMLQQRKTMVDSVNKKFGTNITVKLSSSWEKIRKEIKLREEQISKEEPKAEKQKDVSENNDDENENK